MRIFFITITGLMFALLAHSQDATFIQNLSAAAAQVRNSETSQDFEAAVRSFAALSEQAPEGAWLPDYYLAYVHIRLAAAAMDEGNTAGIARALDQAQEALDRAKRVAPGESEIVALQGYIYTGRIWESPMMNGMRYGSSCAELYEQAIALDPQNPRAHHLMGMHLYFTPRFFGGGAKKALPFLEKAAALYATQQPGLPEPSWGQAFNDQLLSQAQKELER